MTTDIRVINEPEIFRNNVKLKLNNLINNTKICENLEKGIYNFTLNTCDSNNLIKKWNNKYFVLIYIQKLKIVLNNLKNETLYTNLVSKEIKAHEFAFMSHQQMRPDIWDSLVKDKKIKDDNKFTPKIEASTDLECLKCKANEFRNASIEKRNVNHDIYKQCSHYQLQTRSADEAITTFVTCIKCGSRWKC